MAQVTFNVDTGGPIEAAQLGRLLLAINGLHIAAALATDIGDEIAHALHTTGVISAVRRAGRINDALLLTFLAAINSAQVTDHSGGVTVATIRSGSIETVIEEWIDSIYDRFRRLLAALPVAARSSPSQEMLDAISGLRRDARDREVYNVVVAISVVNARVALNSMKVASVLVEEDSVEERSLGA